MPYIADSQQLQSFLGMITFMQPYISHLTHHMAPVWEFLKKNQIFYWVSNTNTAFQKLNSLLTKTYSKLLWYFSEICL